MHQLCATSRKNSYLDVGITKSQERNTASIPQHDALPQPRFAASSSSNSRLRPTKSKCQSSTFGGSASVYWRLLPIVNGVYDESLLLKEWSKMDTNDVMRNFSSKATSIKVPLLKSAIHHDATSSKSSHSNGCFNNWCVPSSNIGNVCYTPGYWEWVEDVLPRHKEILELIKVYDVVYTSLFTYDYDDNILHAFCELWHPSANTLCTFIGEMSISL
ncbi:hypothetical protein KY285_007599 [Solanum tuberosum]|nr:hypothetical protein KY284_007676 [Solanum tuberosum]KAH0745942.1 hypothetical protein KY285_007599 [Solanum tuberosum]